MIHEKPDFRLLIGVRPVFVLSRLSLVLLLLRRFCFFLLHFGLGGFLDEPDGGHEANEDLGWGGGAKVEFSLLARDLVVAVGVGLQGVGLEGGLGREEAHHEDGAHVQHRDEEAQELPQLVPVREVVRRIRKLEEHRGHHNDRHVDEDDLVRQVHRVKHVWQVHGVEEHRDEDDDEQQQRLEVLALDGGAVEDDERRERKVSQLDHRLPEVHVLLVIPVQEAVRVVKVVVDVHLAGVLPEQPKGEEWESDDAERGQRHVLEHRRVQPREALRLPVKLPQINLLAHHLAVVRPVAVRQKALRVRSAGEEAEHELQHLRPHGGGAHDGHARPQLAHKVHDRAVQGQVELGGRCHVRPDRAQHEPCALAPAVLGPNLPP
mmetsp:Transcript_7631/g.15751  ORF Transcript_7631/g.15751 Transcript_7631/m.15751 type:complete len:376 (+) Transcript_7631:996-2123(+)